MTQKELLYVEDAVNHEISMIAYLNDVINETEDEKVHSFFEKEIKFHEEIKDHLLNGMEKCQNEWGNVNDKLFITFKK